MIVKKNLDIFLRLLEKKDKLSFHYVVLLQLGGSILEAFGIALIIPILGVILGQEGSNFFFLSDENLMLKNELNLPSFLIKDKFYLKRLTLIIEKTIIKKVFYPIYSADKHIFDVLEWLKQN